MRVSYRALAESGRLIRRNQAFSGKVLYDQVNGLKRDRRQGGAHRLKDGLGVGMRMVVQKIQNRHALRGGAQPFGSQGLNPVVGK